MASDETTPLTTGSRYDTFGKHIDDDGKSEPVDMAGGVGTVVEILPKKPTSFTEVMPNLKFEEIVSYWEDNNPEYGKNGMQNGKFPKEFHKKLRFKHAVHQGSEPSFGAEKKEDGLMKRRVPVSCNLLKKRTSVKLKGSQDSPDEVVRKALMKGARKHMGTTVDEKAIQRRVAKLAPEYTTWLQNKSKRVFQIPDEKRILFLDCKIKRLSDIQTAEETFTAVFHFYLTYLATEDEADDFTLKELLDEESSFKPEWDPLKQLAFTNKVNGDGPSQEGDFDMKPGYEFVAPPKMLKNEGGRSCKQNSTMYGWKKGKASETSWDITPERLGFDPRYGHWLRVKYECEMTFAEEFELFAFPFDSQDLTIEFGLEPDTSKCDILPFPRVGDFVMLDPRFSLISEWSLAGILVETGISPVQSKSGKLRYRMSLHIKAARRWMASLSYWIVTFCMFLLALATFAMEPVDEVGDRLGFGITFLLADVATLQLLEEKTPAIPYWTLLDYYMYGCFVFLSGIILWSGLIGGITEVPETADYIALWVAVGIFLAYHAIFVLVVWNVSRTERRKLAMTDEELDAHFEGAICCDACKTVLNNPTYEVKWHFDDMLEKDLKGRKLKKDTNLFVQQGEQLDLKR